MRRLIFEMSQKDQMAIRDSEATGNFDLDEYIEGGLLIACCSCNGWDLAG